MSESMNTYKVTFELAYPESDNDIRDAYVLANSFRDAENKVYTRYKKECETAYTQKIEMLEADIIV